MRLREWLAANPAPYRVSLFTVPASGENPAEFTAGQVHLLADEVAADDEGGTLCFYRRDGGGHVVLVEQALSDGVLEGGAWVGRYANLTTPVEGFQRDVLVVVQPDEGSGD
ncbi:MAG: hypothetical protein ACUVSP_09595 [Desulfotomaculales bacterium]